MRVKWSRNLDVPVQQRGQTSTKDSNKDDKRKGFLQIFKFRDRKNEDERKKRNETITQPPKEKTDAKIRKTVTFADQPSPGAAVVCNRKGRRVSADAVDMTIFKVSKCELPDKSQVPSEHSPLFKRNEVSTDVKILDTERKQSQNKSSSLPKFASKGKQTSTCVLSDKKNNCCEAEVHSSLDDQKTVHNNDPNLSRTSNKDEPCTQTSKIPIPISKESFCVTRNIFKTDFWTNNAETSAKTRIPVSLRLGQENVFAESGRKESGQIFGSREEKSDKAVFDEIPVPETSASEKISCKDTEIRIDTNANEKPHRRVSSDETDIKHNLRVENIKHTSIKTTEYSPVGYCGSKLVSPKRKVQVNYSAVVPGEHGFPESTCVQNTELKRFASEDILRQNSLSKKGDFAAKERDVVQEGTVSTSQEISLESKSAHLDKSAIVVSDNATDGLVKDQLISLRKVPIPISIPVENSEKISCQKKLSSPTIISEDEKCVNDDGRIPVPDIKKEPQFDDVALRIPENSGSIKRTVDTGERGNSTLSTTTNNVTIKNMGKFGEIPAINDITSSVNNPVESNVERNVEGFSCSTENVLVDKVKDGVASTADSPIRANSGIENMRNLLDTSVIIVNYKELSSKPWMYSILNQSKEKYPSTKERISCEGGTGSSNTTEDSCIKTDPTSRDDKIHTKEILPIQNNACAEYESGKMTSGDTNQTIEEAFPKSENAAENRVVVEMGHGLHNMVGEILGKGDSFKTETELDNRDSISKLINYDKVAFIDEQVDTPEEITVDSDVEMKTDSRNGDCSANIALNSEIANGDSFKTESSQIVETEQKEEISEVDSYYQSSFSASVLIEHSTDNKEIVKFDDVLVHHHHISEPSKISLDNGHYPNQLENGLRPSVVSQGTEKVSEEAASNAVSIDDISLDKKNEWINSEEIPTSDVHTSLFFTENNKEKFDVLKNVCEIQSQTTNIQFEQNEQHLAAVDVVCHHPPLLEAERSTTTDSKFMTEIENTVESEDPVLRHKGSTYGVLSLDNYDSLEFIDDYPEEETDNETPSIDVYKKSTDVSSWDDSGIGLPGNEDEDRMNVLNERKSLQSCITQDGNTAGFNSVYSSILKSEPKTSQPSFGHGKYGGPAQTTIPPVWSTRVELAQEIQRLGTLCEARTKELNHMKMNFRHASLGFDAFVVLFQYLTEELDAFSQPRLMLELERTHATLEEAEAHLQQYQKEFDELKAKHSQELCELERELNQSHQETIENLTLSHTAEIEELRQSHDKQLAELTESQLKQCQEMEEKHSITLLDLKNEHCQQIEELKMFHADQIEAIENSHHETRMELNSQLKELEQQCKDLKHQAKLVEEALQRDTDTKIQWISAKKADLEKEVDSLKTVLDMRRTEIHSLRKENLEMKKELEKLPVAKEKIKMLEAKAEDLQALVNQKIQVERQLSSDHQHLKENYEKESKVNTRLSMENEELMWKLKQNAEANLILSSFSGSSEALEKSLSPLKSPSKQSVSLPMFFHSIENDIANAEKHSSSASSTTPVTPCKKQPISARKCSSPVRTPSFVAASPPGPCSRRCKVDLKVAVSPRKQSHKSHSSEKKLSSRDASSVSGHASAETAPLKVRSGLQQQSAPIRKGGGTVSQAKYLDEIHYNEELVSMLDESNGSSDDGLCSREMENSDTLLNFEHYNMLITNEMLSRKYRELTHLEKDREFTHTFEEPINSSLISSTNNDTSTSENFSNVAENACHNSSSSRDFTFNNQHFMENEQKECPFFPHQFDYSFLQKKDDCTILPSCENAGDSVVSNSTNTICKTSLPSHQPSGSSSVSIDVSSQVSLSSSDTNCIHPFQSNLLQERNSVPDSKNSNTIDKDLLLDQS